MSETVINNIRILSAEMVQQANSGHPGAPMGMAAAAYVLYSKFMRHSPQHARWISRDRFVLSNGHACALLYTMLHLTGYHFTLDDLKAFRQWGSKTPGHPESGPGANHDGIEITTGPLGSGLSSAVGLAIAERHLAATFNKPDFPIIDNFTYVFCGDGCLQEGVTSEASSLAGHLALGKLIVVYDDNHITIDGDTSLSFTEDVTKRYESYGWQVLHVDDGNADVDAITAALMAARENTQQPTLIRLRTTIGYGSGKAGTHGVHGAPLGADDLQAVKQRFGFDPNESFVVKPETLEALDHKAKGAATYAEWDALFTSYKEKYPELANQLTRRLDKKLPEGWEEHLPTFSPEDKGDATRNLGGAVMNALAPVLPELVGGSADLNPSTKTYLKASVDFQKDSHAGRNIRYGVREHAMASITNGLAQYGGVVPFAATFFNFLGYCLGAVTLSALSRVQAVYVMTHDSIALGEDGPTHQPVEKAVVARATPNLLFIRPADGNETAAAWQAALEAKESPSILALTRQGLPQLKGSSRASALRGAYVLQAEAGADGPDVVVVGTGSEVHVCVAAAEVLASQDGLKVRVVSFPCWELFEQQDAAYQASVFPAGVPTVSVEAGSSFGWKRYAQAHVAIDGRFGASAPGGTLLKEYGFTAENVAQTARTLLKKA